MSIQMQTGEEDAAPVNMTAEDDRQAEGPHPTVEVGHSPNEAQVQ